MSDHRAELRQRLRRLAVLLGDDADSFVVVGGCAPATYDLGVVRLRETRDVDVLVFASSYGQWNERVETFLRKGFRHASDSQVQSRLVLDDLKVDVMATPFRELGFNPWYEGAFAARVRDPSTGLQVIPPLWFLATKLEAWKSRGRGDPSASQHDLEDVVTVLRGSEDTWNDLIVGQERVHRFVRFELLEIANRTDASEVLAGLFDFDEASQAGVEPFLSRLRALT